MRKRTLIILDGLGYGKARGSPSNAESWTATGAISWSEIRLAVARRRTRR